MKAKEGKHQQRKGRRDVVWKGREGGGGAGAEGEKEGRKADELD